MPGDKERRGKGRMSKGTKKLWRRRMNMLIFLTVVMVSRVYT